MQINHASIHLNWNRDEIFDNATKLIIGSFNPFNPNGDNADYYYGRCTNYLWRSIAEIKGENPNIYFNNFELKHRTMLNHNFCFMDMVSKLEIISNNDQVKSRFVDEKIYTEFSDQIIFTSKTSYVNNEIVINREYNNQILDLLENGRITKIIHTMGNNRIDLDFQTNPKERRLGNAGFQNFVQSIRNFEGVDFISESYSPSARAIRTGGTQYYQNLKTWLNQHLDLV